MTYFARVRLVEDTEELQPNNPSKSTLGNGSGPARIPSSSSAASAAGSATGKTLTRIGSSSAGPSASPSSSRIVVSYQPISPQSFSIRLDKLIDSIPISNEVTSILPIVMLLIFAYVFGAI